jgi:cytochrome c553
MERCERKRRSRIACGLSGAWLGLLASHPALAADAAAGREKARQCQTCHSFDGVGKMPDVPNIGGESEIYLTAQLRLPLGRAPAPADVDHRGIM